MAQTAWQQAQECQPDVVIMDITMPELNGVQATAQLKRACPQIKVLALSVHDDTSYLRQLLAAGAAGYILKHAAADDLIQAIRMVAAGGVYLDPALAGHVVAGYVRVPAVASALLGTELSERETEVVQRIAQGYSNKEIASPAQPERQDGRDLPRPRHGKAGHREPCRAGALRAGTRLAAQRLSHCRLPIALRSCFPSSISPTVSGILRIRDA